MAAASVTIVGGGEYDQRERYCFRKRHEKEISNKHKNINDNKMREASIVFDAYCVMTLRRHTQLTCEATSGGIGLDQSAAGAVPGLNVEYLP